jgi:hypothetical protein
MAMLQHVRLQRPPLPRERHARLLPLRFGFLRFGLFLPAPDRQVLSAVEVVAEFHFQTRRQRRRQLNGRATVPLIDELAERRINRFEPSRNWAIPISGATPITLDLPSFLHLTEDVLCRNRDKCYRRFLKSLVNRYGTNYVVSPHVGSYK